MPWLFAGKSARRGAMNFGLPSDSARPVSLSALLSSRFDTKFNKIGPSKPSMESTDQRKSDAPLDKSTETPPFSAKICWGYHSVMSLTNVALSWMFVTPSADAVSFPSAVSSPGGVTRKLSESTLLLVVNQRSLNQL